MTNDESRRTQFLSLYDTHGADILAYAARRTGPHDAADVLADTFAVAWSRIDHVPADPEARLWLFGVARRCLANQQRGRRRVARLQSRLRAEIAATISTSTVDPTVQTIDGRIADAFNSLPATGRELLTLVAWDGLDRAEVAVVMSWSRRRVRVRLHRARQRLLRHLDGDTRTAEKSSAHAQELR